MFYLLIGIVSGVLGGFLGIGGGVVIIPMLVYIFKMTQHQAQGTSLAAMIPPIGLLAAIQYYRAGHVDIKVACLIALGFFLGGLLGATIAQPVSDPLLKKIFGIFLILIGFNMFLGK